MPLKVVICDDNEKARYILRSYLEKLDLSEIEIISEANNGVELIDICRDTSPDVILLDIDMPGINGIDAAKKIIEFLPNASFIFITAYMSYAFDSFEVYPVDFILKPVSIERLEKSLKRIINRKGAEPKEASNSFVTFVSNHEKYSVEQNSIIFIERVGRKTVIHTSVKTFEVYEPISSIQKRLDQDLFTRVHRSYLVNKKSNYKVGKTLGRSRKIIFDGYDKPAYISRKKIKIEE